MTRPVPPMRAILLSGVVLGTALFALVARPRAADAQADVPRPSCESCHGELELLRQHVSTLEEAEALFSPAGALGLSAHGGMTCTDCHSGFRRYPHGETSTETTPCAACHTDVAATWQQGVHALDGSATCTDCHGVHDVRTRKALESAEGARVMRAACGACHFDPAIPENDPHADTVSCAGCHEAHATLPAEDERASTHALNQSRTCGACHGDIATEWGRDVHGQAVPAMAVPGVPPPAGASRSDPPACTGCHGAHGMLTPAEPDFGAEMIERCAHCHEPYAESFSDSYHGQAATLGSEVVATCADCHGAHGIFSAADTRSTVNEVNLLTTCRGCHAEATTGFAKFQPHADHNDREQYPYVYWSYHLMSALLIGVFLVFGAHTLLWLTRLGLDALRGAPRDGHYDSGD